MVQIGILFVFCALIAGFLGFGPDTGSSGLPAKVFFVIFFVLAVMSFVTAVMHRRSRRE
jgi:uncharacterized membrane protein YtjA (UPF0391 family)